MFVRPSPPPPRRGVCVVVVRRRRRRGMNTLYCVLARDVKARGVTGETDGQNNKTGHFKRAKAYRRTLRAYRETHIRPVGGRGTAGKRRCVYNNSSAGGDLLTGVPNTLGVYRYTERFAAAWPSRTCQYNGVISFCISGTLVAKIMLRS